MRIKSEHGFNIVSNFCTFIYASHECNMHQLKSGTEIFAIWEFLRGKSGSFRFIAHKEIWNFSFYRALGHRKRKHIELLDTSPTVRLWDVK